MFSAEYYEGALNMTESIFSDRIADVPRSFIREILKVTLSKDVISFAGGLPNRDLFPVEEIKEATQKVFAIYGSDIFQYSNSEGHLKLREFISARYRQKKNLNIPVDNILITSGSQQALDLLGKVLLNDRDGLVIEEPGYLGAIQAFSLYKPRFLPVKINETGMDTDRLRELVVSEKPKMMYTVPTFQNPSGISYTPDNRREIAKIIERTPTILIEDDAYGDLRFTGESKESFKALLPEQCVLTGSFSKTIIPGFRLGWVVASDAIMDKLIVAKQAADLHTSHFTQSIIYQYLKDNDVDQHIRIIREAYGKQCHAMLRAMEDHFPKEMKFTRPDGGMFTWAELPEELHSLELFDLAAKDNVIFVPGDPFYVGKTKTRTMRLNFSCVDEATILVGIQRLGKAIQKLMDKRVSV